MKNTYLELFLTSVHKKGIFYRVKGRMVFGKN